MQLLRVSKTGADGANGYIFVLLYFCLLLLRRRQSKEYHHKYQFSMGFQAVYASCRSEIRARKMSFVSGPIDDITHFKHAELIADLLLLN